MSKPYRRVEALSFRDFCTYMRAHGVPGTDAKFKASVIAGVYEPEIRAVPKKCNRDFDLRDPAADYWFTITVAACDKWIERNVTEPEEENPQDAIWIKAIQEMESIG